MRAERAAREGEATVAAERRREQEGLTLSEEFGEPAAAVQLLPCGRRV